MKEGCEPYLDGIERFDVLKETRGLIELYKNIADHRPLPPR
ncbi:MAG: hypothetical protein WD688_17925 [Candidatus Binatia bacterium]